MRIHTGARVVVISLLIISLVSPGAFAAAGRKTPAKKPVAKSAKSPTKKTTAKLTTAPTPADVAAYDSAVEEIWPTDTLKINVFVTAGNVERMAESDWHEAARLLRQSSVTGVYLDVYRDGVSPSEDKLRAARDFMRGEGFDVYAGITTTKGAGFGVGDPNNRYWLCYAEPSTIDAIAERARVAASLFDRLIVDDFFATNCKCSTCDTARGDRSWSEYFRDVMVEAGAEAIVKPTRAANPRMRVIIKFPQWYDRFARFGYDVPRESDVFDNVWVGTETRDPKLENVMQYEAFNNYRWIRSIAGMKVMGGWFDQINSGPDVYLEQAVQTVLAGAPEFILFQYTPDQFMNPDAVRLRDRLPVLQELAARLRGLEPRGIVAYKPPYGDPAEDHYIFDYLGMLGLPIVLTATRPAGARVAFFPAHSASDPETGAAIRDIVSHGGTALLTSSALDALKSDPDLMALAGFATDGVKKATRYTTRFVVAGREAAAPAQVELGALLKPNTAVVLATATLATSSVPALTRHEVPGGGAIVVLNTRTFTYDEKETSVLPAKYAFIMNLPAEAAQALRDIMLKPLGVKLTAPTRVAIYLYGSKYVALVNFNDEPADVTMSLPAGLGGGKVRGLRAVLPTPGETQKAGKNTWKLTLPPRDFTLLRAE